MPRLRKPSGERGLALATDKVIDGAPLQVPRLTGRLLDTLSFLLLRIILSTVKFEP